MTSFSISMGMSKDMERKLPTNNNSSSTSPVPGSIVFGGPSGREEEVTTVTRPNEERIDTAALPWHRRVLESFTMYGEISAARIPEEFAPVRMRFQREWTFNGGFVSRFIIMFCLALS
jgi:hypothetical protein